MRPDLIRWQWDGYPDFHKNKTNLRIHIVAVPMFIGATLSLVSSLVSMHWMYAASSAVTAVVAFLAQGIGHKRESSPPIPFDGPLDAIRRILAEQFINFPRFLFSGGWRAALSNAKD